MLTPFQFASNMPIMAVDLNGLEAMVATIVEKKGNPDVPLNATRGMDRGLYESGYTRRTYFIPGVGASRETPYVPGMAQIAKDKGYQLNTLFAHISSEIPVDDGMFALGIFARNPYYDLGVETSMEGSRSGYANAIIYDYSNATPDWRILKASSEILFDLLLNPNQGGQVNISGASGGSIIAAQTTLYMIREYNIKIDIVSLIGSPINKNSRLFKALEEERNKGNVGKLVYDLVQLPGDDVTGMASTNNQTPNLKAASWILKQEMIGSDPPHPHKRLATDPIVWEQMIDALINAGTHRNYSDESQDFGDF